MGLLEGKVVASSRGPEDPNLGDAFEREFGTNLQDLLDVSKWETGQNLSQVYGDLEAQVGQAIAQEKKLVPLLRSKIFPEIADRTRRGAPAFAGVHTVSLDALKKIHAGTLFCGDVQACDGTYNLHDNHVLTASRIGVCLINYSGDQGTWEQRLYRRDLRGAPADRLEEVYALLEARERRSAIGRNDGEDRLTELGTRGLMTYAERAILAHQATAPWRMGQGQPAPYEILTGSGKIDVVQAGLSILRKLILDHKKFVFVPSEPRHRGLLTLGFALRPLEFAIVNTLEGHIEDIVERGHLRGKRREDAEDFVREVGRKVAVGIYRASNYAPPHMFYAPAEPELCAQAAAIAMADSVLQPHRGFPLLLEMADRFCKSAFNQSEFDGTIGAAFAAHGGPMTYFTERQTRS